MIIVECRGRTEEDRGLYKKEDNITTYTLYSFFDKSNMWVDSSDSLHIRTTIKDLLKLKGSYGLEFVKKDHIKTVSLFCIESAKILMGYNTPLNRYKFISSNYDIKENKYRDTWILNEAVFYSKNPYDFELSKDYYIQIVEK